MWARADIENDSHLQYYYLFDNPGPFPTDQITTSDFILDRSGKSGNRNLSAVNRASGSVWWPSGDPRLPTCGALGLQAMQFNYLQYQWIGWGPQLGLIAQHSYPMERNTTFSINTPVGTGSTFSVWLAYVPTGPQDIAPYDPPGPTLSVISTWTRSFGIGNYGCQLGFITGTGELYYTVGSDNNLPGFSWTSGRTFAPNEWFTFTNIIEKTSEMGVPPLTLRRAIYINGVLHTEIEGTAAQVPTAQGGQPLSFGTGWSDDIRNSHGRGLVGGSAYFDYPKLPQPVTVNFDGSPSTGDKPFTYEWQMGDDTQDSGLIVAHEYFPGSYDVTLTITDEHDQTDDVTHTVTIEGPPSPSAIEIPPPLPALPITIVAYGIQQDTDVSWNASPVDMWKVVTNDGTGENVVISSDSNHCASPVWGTDLDRIVYQECADRAIGAPTPTTKLCTVKKDGTNRTVIHDTGVVYTGAVRNDYQGYCMSPDGTKVAFLDDRNSHNLKCVWADGSGDCGGGVLSDDVASGNPQWSLDSETIYVSEYPFGIVAIPFDGGTHTTIYAPNDLDYFWLSNDGTKFASGWYGGGRGFTIIGIDGTPIYQHALSDLPWPNPAEPVNICWAPDDSFLLLDHQNHSFPNFTNSGICVRTTPDLSDWMMFEPPAESEHRGIVNFTLALVGGEMKVLGAITDTRELTYGTAIYQWNLNGTQEGFLVPGSWDDAVAPVWDRYAIGGMPVCTDEYGTQVWDI